MRSLAPDDTCAGNLRSTCPCSVHPRPRSGYADVLVHPSIYAHSSLYAALRHRTATNKCFEYNTHTHTHYQKAQ